jgi:hypothetical protein
VTTADQYSGVRIVSDLRFGLGQKQKEETKESWRRRKMSQIRNRVARFFSTQYTKTWKDITNYNKITKGNATAVWTLPCIKLLGTIQEVWRQKKKKEKKKLPKGPKIHPMAVKYPERP